MKIDGKDAFINRLGRRAQVITAQIWRDYQQGSFDRSLMAYQPLINGKQVVLLRALLLKRSRCLNISAFCRSAIAEKLERLEIQEAVK